MRALILAIALVAATMGAAAADAFEDATAAVKRRDYTGAERVLLPLAESGDLRAQISVANLYEGWWVLPRRHAEAAKWYRRAAEQGSAAAQHQLADMYLHRQGLPFDPGEASKWYRRAAGQGYYAAQYELSRMYADGWGVPRDYVSAHMWLSLAISNGYSGRGRLRSSGGRGELRGLERYMMVAEIAEAQKRASEWKPRPER